MQTTPPSLSHFVIFNPTLKPPPLAQDERPLSNVEDDPDDQKAHQQEEDRKDAAQILFYTSRSSRTVSRETMLKQTRLVKGLMGFTDMLVPSNPPSSTSEEPVGLGEKEEPFLSIRTGKSRMIVIQPEKDFYIHLNIVLATAVGEDGQSEPTHNAQGLSDHTIVQAVERGYEDFKVRLDFPSEDNCTGRLLLNLSCFMVHLPVFSQLPLHFLRRSRGSGQSLPLLSKTT